ncbi:MULTISPECIES: glycerophosphodiester phosphodiesterase family protein [unclassified Enterococcus]|jgi:glycerophosphoryl diester phosphodiesterase|uniref:glycerophosphodiester phosphodiesterase family protein n=1 Tax=unclassified Enterococcus TaxID=2608891 RepID=UPI0003549904|nr:glycerophosphodiester phosphodiesterase family protein [Enterococcus faecalis 13-SD-W-01]
MIQIYAHRGSSGTHPENTLPAFAEAVRVGADAVELDVHLSKDQELIVMHDEEVDRTTNGKGLIREKTLAEIKQLNAGSWFDKNSSARVPTLKETFDLFLQKNYRGMVMIELKTDKFQYPQIEEKVAELAASRDWPFQHSYCSFNQASLEKMAELEPGIQLDLLMRDSKKKPAIAQELSYIEGLHPHYQWVLDNPDAAKDFSKALRVWTVDDEALLKEVLGWAINGVITDYPEKALRIRQSIKSR